MYDILLLLFVNPASVITSSDASLPVKIYQWIGLLSTATTLFLGKIVS